MAALRQTIRLSIVGLAIPPGDPRCAISDDMILLSGK